MKHWLLIVLCFCMGITMAQIPTPEAKRKYDQADKFIEVINLIRTYYTDTVNEEPLIEDAIKKVLEDLDPHSSYVPAKDVKRSEEGLVGNFEGVGITFQILKDTIMVLEVIPGGPSEKVGLRAGDKIIKVNDTIVAGVKIENEGVIKKLRGPKGTKVRVAMMRQGEGNLIDFTITRDKIPIYSITATYMVQPGIGYMRLERFSATTLQEFSQGLEKLRAQGMTDLIFDLQGNVGGYLYTAVDMCNQFLGDNKLIVYTQGVHASYQPYFSNNHGSFKDGKIVVMIDEGSASAAEILSGCIQDNDRGLLVGRRTFGKGLVQKPFTLSDGSQLKLTTAHYYTPSGRCIQKPYGQGNKDYREDYKERLESGELFGKDTFKFADSLHYKTSNGRDVYGGGGVQPDFFVPIDTSANSPLFNQLIRKGVENRFCLDYVDKHRGELNSRYASADSFFYNFEVDTILLAQYVAAAVVDSAIKLKDGMQPKTFWQYFGAVKNDTVINFERDFAKSEKLIKARLKANIGRNLFDTGMFYRVINATVNNVFAKAVEVMTNNSKFNVLKPKEEKTGPDKVKTGKEKGKKKIKIVTNEKTK
ncbi:MAG TPA: S41 family peptidase [Chitinophagales bacterium]|nr:S41 family peptidase [Chitinophagales bacterium]